MKIGAFVAATFAGLFVGTTLNPCVEHDAIECDVNVPALVFGCGAEVLVAQV